MTSFVRRHAVSEVGKRRSPGQPAVHARGRMNGQEASQPMPREHHDACRRLEQAEAKRPVRTACCT
jgi:hypothetical protein